MATGFTVFGKLAVSTAEAEAAITSSFAQLESQNKKSQRRIDKLESKREKEREKRREGRRRAVRGAGFGIAGGVAAAAAAGARDTLAFQKTLAGVQIQAGASAEKMAVFEAALTATSRKTALSKQELALAAETLTNLLGPAAIENAKLLDLLARTSVATGSDVTELAGLISAVSDSMGIAVTDTDNMERALSAFVRAGKEGKIPLSEMASTLQAVSSTFKEVGVGGVQSAADLSSALQVLRKSTDSAAKAGTILEAGITTLVQKSEEFKKVGIDVFIGKGPEKRLRGLRDILDQISEKRLNIKQLQDILGRKEAVKFFRTLQDPAAREEFERLAKAAANATDITTDFGKRTETQAFRIQKAMNDAKIEISEAMTPERIETFVTILSGAVTAAGFLADKFVGLGTAIGEGVFDLEDFLFGTREIIAATARINENIDVLQGKLRSLQDQREAQIKEEIALRAKLAVVEAEGLEGQQVTTKLIKERLTDAGLLPEQLPAAAELPFAPVLEPVREAITAERGARVEQALLAAARAIQDFAEKDPGTKFAEVTLAPEAIDALNQRSFQRAQADLPTLPAGRR